MHKHIFNRHSDVLTEKFNKKRFEHMKKENYFADPHKITSSFSGYGNNSSGGGY